MRFFGGSEDIPFTANAPNVHIKHLKRSIDMKKTALRLVVLILTVIMTFSLTSCDLVFEIVESIIGDMIDSNFGDGTDDTDKDNTDKGDNGNTDGKTDDGNDKNNGTVVIKPDENTDNNPENAYNGLHSGYNITTNKIDSETHYVSSYYEGDRIVDKAIANHYSEVTVDYSAMGEEFSVEDLQSAGKRELGHAKIKYSYYKSKPHTITYNIDYNTATASYALEQTEDNTYENFKNGNMLVRDYLVKNSDNRREDSFDGFAINTNNIGKMDVYNSEELWWALEHNYLPMFPENSKAEAIYNDSKDILRRIIKDDMTDYEKALAIFEYLVDRVSYDYDAFYSTSADSNNACYYLEGIFEYNRAVCDGKSKAFVLLCRIEGIECVRDWGSSLNGGAGHAWNYVKLDGNWYMVDTTAGDAGTTLDGTNGDKIKTELTNYEYFACPINAYKSDCDYSALAYEYSGIWDALLLGNDNSASLADGYFDFDLYSKEGTDFIIDNYDELNFIIDTMIMASAQTEYTLQVSLSETVDNIHSATDAAITEYQNIEYAVYSADVGYILVFFVSVSD